MIGKLPLFSLGIILVISSDASSPRGSATDAAESSLAATVEARYLSIDSNCSVLNFKFSKASSGTNSSLRTSPSLFIIGKNFVSSYCIILYKKLKNSAVSLVKLLLLSRNI